MSTSPRALDVKIFLPTKDFELSLQFYQAIGWKLNWRHGQDMAEIELADQSLLLQNYYDKQWAHNFMMYIRVSDAEQWYQLAKKVIDEGSYDEAKYKAPKEEGHAKVSYVWDPCGVLLHFAQERTKTEV